MLHLIPVASKLTPDPPVTWSLPCPETRIVRTGRPRPRSPSCIIRDAVACPLALMWSTLLDSAHSSVLSPFAPGEGSAGRIRRGSGNHADGVRRSQPLTVTQSTQAHSGFWGPSGRLRPSHSQADSGSFPGLRRFFYVTYFLCGDPP